MVHRLGLVGGAGRPADGREHLDIRPYEVGGIAGDVRPLGHHHCHYVADESDPIGGERRPGHRLRSTSTTPQRMERELCGGVYADDTRHLGGGLDIDGRDDPVRHRRPDQGHVQHTVGFEIVDIPAGTGQEPRILDTFHVVAEDRAAHGAAGYPSRATSTAEAILHVTREPVA